MMTKEQMKQQTRFAKECARAAAREKEFNDKREVMIKNIYSMEMRCDIAVSLVYGDIIKIINMLYDYIVILDETEKENVVYQWYLRGRLQHIKDSLCEQIGYDFDAALKRCRKKAQEDDDDVGGEALEQLIRKGAAEARAKEKKRQEEEAAKEPPKMEQMSLFDM